VACGRFAATLFRRLPARLSPLHHGSIVAAAAAAVGAALAIAAFVPDARANARASAWPSVAVPSSGPARVIGGSGAACIAGAASLPLEGPGYQAVDLSRRRHYGHPALLAFIADLGRQAAAGRWGTVLVGDMAQPRGGPMPSGHVSHQGGLDVDLWFRLDVPPLPRARRDGIPQPSVVDPATGRPDPRRWSDAQAALVRAAALDGRVARVFVGAALKRDLCQRAWPDRGWLHVVRPWPGHDDHLHVRLRCPAGSPACRDQPPLPAGDGCSAAELAPAFARERARARRPPPRAQGFVPAACTAVLGAAD
jgi:penicillin-insensitive murein DD-endopeptidase